MSLKKNILANYLGQGWVALMGLAFIPIYIKYLGMEAYGLIGFHATLHAWLSFAGNILGPVANREVARLSSNSGDHQTILDRLRSLEWVGLGCAVGVISLLGLTSQLISKSWIGSTAIPFDVIVTSIALMGFVIGLRILETLYQGIIAGLQQQPTLNAANASVATLRWVGAIGVLKWYSPSIEYFFIWQVATSVISLLVLRSLAYRWLPRPERRPRFSPIAIKSLRNFTGGVLATTLLALLLTNIDKLLLSKLLSLQEFGVYMFAFTAASGLLFLTNPISQAFYPKLSQLVAKGDGRELANHYHRGSKLVTLSIGPACILMGIFSKEIVFAWTGDHLLAGQVAPLLSVLIFGNGLHALMHMPYMLQLASGWPSLSARINALACIVLVPALMFSVPIYGPIAAGMIWILLNAGYLLLGIFLMHQKILENEKYKWYINDILKPLLYPAGISITAFMVLPNHLSREVTASTIIGLAFILYSINAFVFFRQESRIINKT